jgi:hypothetical protein
MCFKHTFIWKYIKTFRKVVRIKVVQITAVYILPRFTYCKHFISFLSLCLSIYHLSIYLLYAHVLLVLCWVIWRINTYIMGLYPEILQNTFPKNKDSFLPNHNRIINFEQLNIASTHLFSLLFSFQFCRST